MSMTSASINSGLTVNIFSVFCFVQQYLQVARSFSAVVVCDFPHFFFKMVEHLLCLHWWPNLLVCVCAHSLILWCFIDLNTFRWLVLFFLFILCCLSSRFFLVFDLPLQFVEDDEEKKLFDCATSWFALHFNKMLITWCKLFKK